MHQETNFKVLFALTFTVAGTLAVVMAINFNTRHMKLAFEDKGLSKLGTILSVALALLNLVHFFLILFFSLFTVVGCVTYITLLFGSFGILPLLHYMILK